MPKGSPLPRPLPHAVGEGGKNATCQRCGGSVPGAAQGVGGAGLKPAQREGGPVFLPDGACATEGVNENEG